MPTDPVTGRRVPLSARPKPEAPVPEYQPVSSAARQAWIDGEDNPAVLRSIDAEQDGRYNDDDHDGTGPLDTLDIGVPLQEAPPHPYTDGWCGVCGCPDGVCTGQGTPTGRPGEVELVPLMTPAQAGWRSEARQPDGSLVPSSIDFATYTSTTARPPAVWQAQAVAFARWTWKASLATLRWSWAATKWCGRVSLWIVAWPVGMLRSNSHARNKTARKADRNAQRRHDEMMAALSRPASTYHQFPQLPPQWAPPPPPPPPPPVVPMQATVPVDTDTGEVLPNG